MMSSSPRRVLAGGARSPSLTPLPFPYETVPAEFVHTAVTDPAPAAREKTDQNFADAAAREAQALAQGRLQGQSEARKLFEDQLAKERASLAATLADFARGRTAYFQQVEAEVVQLALAIARKVLYREAQMDPLLLAAIVRVALERIEGATAVVLRVHPQHAADWRRYLATRLQPSDLPEIVEDAGQAPDTCVLETSMGKTELGLEVQLKEIERGLLDLVAVRPGAAP